MVLSIGKFHAFITFPLMTTYFLSLNPFIKSIFFNGMLLCIFILYQGQRYWHLKLKRLENKPFSQSENLQFFKKRKRINWLLISGIPVVLIFQFLTVDWLSMDSEIILWSVLANLFAVLDHINCYHRQLMVDNSEDLKYLIRNKRFKKASLAKDLQENRF
ncbi:hypothetical protein EI546_16055 [Aequorivita sp. H23M31]|uniref:General stress protein n=1 Tax=Aequorivita ciconiae TaxID=2494375 RepID=A0A410G758_9FLAO|nr:hypothetical protein [Aequorivita sp. H23M31]QAA83128.1 hypothetical protein EI546_16055 [Aequorivita sp. H23M31]